MHCRKHRKLKVGEVTSVLFVAILIPALFIYELVVVLPAFHEPGGVWYYFAVFLRTFFLLNIVGNLVIATLIDNSVNFDKLVPPADALSRGWHRCTLCDKLAPPRSWHCKICRVCILKRDHHCSFMANCVGHRNHRFFVMLVFYVLIASIYEFVYNSIFIWFIHASVCRNWFTPLKLFLPPVMFFHGTSWTNIMLTFYFLNVLVVFCATILFIRHFPLVIRGNVSYERKKGNIYDKGCRKNLREILGKHMYVAALLPFVPSKLPNEKGIEWPTNKEQMQLKDVKPVQNLS